MRRLIILGKIIIMGLWIFRLILLIWFPDTDALIGFWVLIGILLLSLVVIYLRACYESDKPPEE